MTRTISEDGRVQLIPTWRGVLPALMWASRDGTTTGRQIAREELSRMAEAANMAPGEPLDIRDAIDLREALGPIIADLRGDDDAKRRAAEIDLERMAVAADRYNASVDEAA